MNAASLRTFAAQSAAAGESLWMADVSLAGAEAIPAAITDPKGIPSMIPGAEIDQGELIVRIRKDILPEKPALHIKLQWKRPDESTWRAEAWRITEATGTEADAVWLIKCAPWN